MGEWYDRQVTEKETQTDVREAVQPHQNQGNMNKNHNEM